MATLDREDLMPNFVISYKSLKVIPRSHPEELNNITLCDRLNQLEEKINNLQLTSDRTVAENLELRERIDDLSSGKKDYASAVKSSFPGGKTPETNQPKASNTIPVPQINIVPAGKTESDGTLLNRAESMQSL